MSSKDDQPKRLVLQLLRSEAQKRIEAQIKQGYAILGTRISSDTGLYKALDRSNKWHNYNKDLLKLIVNTEELYREYNQYMPTKDLMLLDDVKKNVSNFRYVLKKQLQSLESIHQRLELLPEAPNTNNLLEEPATPQPAVNHNIGRRIFIVHGHDEKAKLAVARCIEKLGLKAIILQEQPEQGRTIIEKFEDYANVDFAVVLLTPDDVGASQKAQDALRPRARQNVILELGFFIGKLGRKHVCALYKGDVERPSDVSGVLWILMDDHDAWQLKLAREMKQAGLAIDVNQLFG